MFNKSHYKDLKSISRKAAKSAKLFKWLFFAILATLPYLLWVRLREPDFKSIHISSLLFRERS